MPIFFPVTVILAILIIIFLFRSFYRKCPPNKAMVITGPTGTSTVIGRAKFVIPFIQRVDYMSLENIQVDFTSKDQIPTQDAINILVDAVANMAIDQDPEVLKIASSKFLGYSTEDIQRIVLPILEGNIREIISQTTLVDLIRGDKKEFAERVVQNVAPNLRDMGLKLTTFNIQNFKDNDGVIKNLGIENTVQISKEASKAKAAAEAEIAIAQADADKRANDARVAADAEIAAKQNELSIRKAELDKNASIKQAESDAASGIEQENQRKLREVATAEANLAKQEKEIELKEREVKITERQLEINIKKQAEAERYAAEQRAEAEKYAAQQKAEAEKFEAERQAEAKKVMGIAEAEAERARGEAEANSIRLKAEAEAEGLLKKAEAMKQYGDAARQQMELDTLKVYFEQLPKIAEAIGNGYAGVDSIKFFGTDSSQLSGNMVSQITQVTESLQEATGIDINTVLAGFLGGKIAQEKAIAEKEEKVTAKKAGEEDLAKEEHTSEKKDIEEDTIH